MLVRNQKAQCNPIGQTAPNQPSGEINNLKQPVHRPRRRAPSPFLPILPTDFLLEGPSALFYMRNERLGFSLRHCS